MNMKQTMTYQQSVKVLSAILITAMMMLYGCGGTGSSSVGKIGGDTAVDSADIKILAHHSLAHEKRLEHVFKLSPNGATMNLLREATSTFDPQDLNSNYLNAVIRLYASACSEVSEDVIPNDITFEDVYFMMTGLVPSEHEKQIALEINALLGSETPDVLAYGNCLVASTSLFAITPMTNRKLEL